jgi:drug/metabolite transporter (DMT)-like permease
MIRLIFPHIALFLANTIYAVNYLFAKDVMPNYITPTGFILLRVLSAALIFYLIHSFFIKEKLHKQDILYILICAIFGIVINMLCFFEGLNLTNPINASLIMITTPLIVYVLSLVFKKEAHQYRKLIGVILGLFGASLLITDGVFNFRINNLGDVLVLLNAISYGIYLILIKSMMEKYHPITVLKNLFLLGLIILIPIGWPDLNQINFSEMPVDIVLKVLFVLLFTTCGAYFLNIYAISKVSASTVAFYIYLQPLLATTLAVILKKDILTEIKLVSAFFIFLGVYFVIKRDTT